VKSVIAFVAVLAAGLTDAAAATPPLAARSWAADLPPIAVKNRNTNAEAKIRLYNVDDGSLDQEALRTFMRVACSKSDVPDGDVVEPLDPRLVQLAFRAAYHFNGASMLIVSATRKGHQGKHGTGEAIDLKLGNVRASSVAAYARSFARAGVGLYDHPETQYTHLDVRARSWHWSDSSRPGGALAEKVMADPMQQKRDASYVPAQDLPEAAAP